MKISIIAAIGRNKELGKDNKLLWHIPEDFKRFKALTSGHPIIMGRKTWESLPIKPLPNRTNIVVTRDSSFSFARRSFARRPLAKLAGSLEEAIEIAKKTVASAQGFGPLRSEASEPKEVFIIGGGQIYEQAIQKDLVDKLYLTIVDGEFDADTFFPDYSEFKKVISEESKESEGHKYKFIELVK